MAPWRGQEAVGVVSPRGRVRIVSLVCLVMVSLTPHILSGWLLRPLLVSVNIPVLGVVCFQSREALVHWMCLRDSSTEATRGCAMGSLHVEEVMSCMVVFMRSVGL